jgi:hypothetical protein
MNVARIFSWEKQTHTKPPLPQKKEKKKKKALNLQILGW